MASPKEPSGTPETTKATQPPQQPMSRWEYMTNRRSRKQASLFFLGATLFTFSTLITKRSLHYRRQLAYPLFYMPSNGPLPPINGTLEALRALQLATANVVSSMIMISGGLLWAFDISSMEDLRTSIRASVGQERVKGDREIEVEFEQWLASKKKAQAEKGGSNEEQKDTDRIRTKDTKR